jgi:hypothetical protein
MTIQKSQIINPYVGPRSFKEEDKENFFGRALECQKLLNLLISARIVLFYSSSGAGKTSLIQSALIPKIRTEVSNFTILPCIRLSFNKQPDMSEGNRYILSIVESLTVNPTIDIKAPETLTEKMTLQDFFNRLDTGEKSSGRPTNKLFIFDQFEEIFTINPVDIEQKQKFFEELGEALEVDHRWALFSMREEYIANLDPYRHLIPYEFKSTFRLELLNVEAARLAIIEPAKKKKVTFSDEAVNHLLDEVRLIRWKEPEGEVEKKYSPYVEPLLLQLACCRVWEEFSPSHKNITLDDVSRYGYIDQIFSLFYEDSIQAALTNSQIDKQQIRDWCEKKLITPMQTRGLVLQESQTTAGLPNKVVKKLEDLHLIRAERRSGAIWYELIHDRFIEPILESNRTQIFKTPPHIFSKDEIDSWLKDKAYELSCKRRLTQLDKLPLDQFVEKLKGNEGELLDWLNAHFLFAIQVFDGNIKFAHQKIPEIYALLEELWFSDVKRFKAYLIWEKESGRYPDNNIHFFYKACKEIRDMIIESQIKAPRSNFERILRYLEDNYLTVDGKLDEDKQEVEDILRRKAERLWVITSHSDATANWSNAKEYAKLFYENIIPAVKKDDPEKVEKVLKAFGFSETQEHHYYSMINCFEVALAIYFLPDKIIRNLWEKKPELRDLTL